MKKLKKAEGRGVQAFEETSKDSPSRGQRAEGKLNSSENFDIYLVLYLICKIGSTQNF
jgi:hypothetical protein